MLQVEKALSGNRQGFLYAGIKYRLIFTNNSFAAG